MVKMKLDKKSVNAITKKLKTMPAKMQKAALRKTIDPEAKKLQRSFKAVTPIGKRNHRNKMTGTTGKGFLKRSFSVRNTGKGDTVGRGVIVRAQGYYVHMSPNETGHKKGNKRGVYYWGAVPGAKKYSTLWQQRQLRVLGHINRSLGLELTKL